MPVRDFLSHVGAWPESSLSKCNKFSPSESWTICTSQTSFELVLDCSIHANTLILEMELLMKSTGMWRFPAPPHSFNYKWFWHVYKLNPLKIVLVLSLSRLIYTIISFHAFQSKLVHTRIWAWACELMLVPQQVSSGIIGDTFDAWWLFFRVWKVKSTPTMARKLQTPSCSKSATPQHYKGLVFTCQLCCEIQTGHWWKEGLARKLIKVMYTLIILLFFWFPPFLPGIFRFWIFHNLSIDINAFFLPCPCFNCWVPICP